MRKMKTILPVAVPLCLIAAFVAGACIAFPGHVQDALVESGDADSAATTVSANAVETANSILEQDAKVIDDGFDLPSNWSDSPSTTGTDATGETAAAESSGTATDTDAAADGASDAAADADEAALLEESPEAGDASAALADAGTSTTAANELAEGSYKYLSEYTPIVNEIGWSTRKDDVNYDGNQISLIVNGTRTYFYKGVSMHATAKVVYDFGEGNEYDTFDTYMGIDASRGSLGYASMKIYTSANNEDWTAVDYTFLGNGQKEAAHVTISLEGVRYLKIECNSEGANASDHTCLGGAVLYKGSYTPSTEAPVIKKIADLDAILNATNPETGKPYTSEEIIATKGDAIGKTGEETNTLYMTMLRRSLVNKVGYDAFTHSFFDCSERTKRVAMMEWLWNDEEALEDFVTGGTPNSGGYLKSLIVLANLYDKYGDDLDDTTALFVDANGGTHDGPASNRGELYRIVMIAIALTHDNGPYMWQASNNASDPLERYFVYRRSYEANILRNDVYENLTVEEMRWVMGGRIWNDEVYWLNRYAYNARPTAGYPLVYSPHYFIAYGKDWNYAAKGYFNLDNYAQYDTKYKLTEYFVNPPTTLSKCWMALEGSQICWGISYLGTTFANSYGVPSKYVRQAGHAAFFVYNRNSSGQGIWGIDNNISGWTGTWVNEDTVGNGNARMLCDWGTRGTSNVSEMNSTYIQLCQASQDDIVNYEKAEALITLEAKCTTNAQKVALYWDVLDILPYHWDAWRGLVSIYKSDSTYTTEDLAELSTKLCDAMWYFPLPMHDLMNQIYSAAKSKAAAALTAANAMPEDTEEEQAAKALAIQAAQRMNEDVALIAANEGNALAKGTKANTNGTDEKTAAAKVTGQTDVLATMANYLKGSANTAIADFSFTGDNANRIVFGSTYQGVRYRVSFDGGETWTETGANVTTADKMYYELTDADKEAINATDDILIWLEGWPGGGTESQDPVVENAYRIDILAGGTLNDSTEPNDFENRFMAVQANAEYSKASADNPDKPDGNWAPLTTETDFTGYAGKVFVRIAANGRTMAGVCDESKNFYTFTNNYTKETDPKHVYIPISELSYDSCSSEETSRSADQAWHVTDGRRTTRWHTLWDGSDKDKWVTIKLDSPTYVSQIAYTPIKDAGNGTIYNCEVYVSLDNLTWVKAAANSTRWAKDNTIKYLAFDNPVYGQYVRIKATNTVGNYASALKFDIFEDTTFASKKLIGFTLTQNPDKLEYVEGEKLDLTGAKIEFNYADGSKAEMPISYLTASEDVLELNGRDTTTETHTIYVSFGSLEAKSFDVTVSKRTGEQQASALTLVSEPDKTTYYVGDELALDGMQVAATIDGRTVYLGSAEYQVTGSTASAGTQAVTVSYGGKQASFNITVKQAVDHLELDSLPANITYKLGDTFDETGIQVVAVYKGGETETRRVLEAGEYTLLGINTFSETAGDIKITAALADKETIGVDFVVTVYPYFTRDGINYSLSTFYNKQTESDELAIFVTGFCSDREFTSIPASITVGTRSYPVRGIESGAMTNVTGVKEIALPGSIMQIETGAFTGGGTQTEEGLVEETVENIYLTEHSSFEYLDAADGAFDPDTNLVLFAGTDGLTTQLKQKDFAKEMQVQDVTSKIVRLELGGSYKTSFNRGDAFTSAGLQVTGVLADGNTIALAPAAYTVSTPDMTKVGQAQVTIAPTFVNDPPVDAVSYTIEVQQVWLKITKNPQSAVYYRGETGEQIAALTVEAQSELSGDVLLYQWYRVAGSTPSLEDDIIAGATESSYRPSESGKYYAVVSVQGQGDHSVQSMMAEVEIGDYAAIVGSKGYTDLNAAVAAASGQTVHLLKDVTITSGISVSHSFTLDGKDEVTGESHVIKRGASFTGAFVTIGSSATVTLSNVVLDGGAVWNPNKWKVDLLERGTGNDGIVAQMPLVWVESSAQLYLNEGVILRNNANPSTNTGGAIRANNYAAIYMNGAQIRDCYSYWFGSAIYFRDHSSVTISGDSMIHGCSGTSEKNTTALCADNSATLTINGGTFCHNLGYSAGGVIWACDGKVTINGGSFVNNGLYNSSSGQAETEGKGVTLWLKGSAAVNVSDYKALQSIYLASDQTITVSGDLSDNTALSVQTKTAGASCVAATSADYLAAAMDKVTINGNAVAVKDGKLASSSGVSKVAHVTIANKQVDCTSLADAIDLVEDNQVVTLVADTALGKQVTVNKCMEIELSDYSVSDVAANLVAGTGYKKYVQLGRVMILRDDIKVSAASLALQDNLAIQYKVSKDVAANYDSVYVTFTMNGKQTTVTSYKEAGDYLVFTYGDIAPQQMGDTMTSVVYATKGLKTYHGPAKSYGVSTYCYNILKKTDADTTGAYAKLRTLLVDLLNYGAAAQTYANYKTDALVNANLTQAQRSEGTTGDLRALTSAYSESSEPASPDATWYSASLTLDNAIAMNLKFKASSVEGVTAKVELLGSDGETVEREWTLGATRITPVVFDDQTTGYSLYFNGLNAAQLSGKVRITLYQGQEQISRSLTYSVETYAKNVLEGTTASSELKALVTAMMKYGDSAAAYKASLAS